MKVLIFMLFYAMFSLTEQQAGHQDIVTRRRGQRRKMEKEIEDIKFKMEWMETKIEEEHNRTEQFNRDMKYNFDVLRGMASQSMFVATEAKNLASQAENVASKCIDDACPSNGHMYHRSYNRLMRDVKDTYSRSEIYESEQFSYRFSLIESHLWIPRRESKSIVILTKAGIQKKTLTFEHINPTAVRGCGDEVLVCSYQGLYVININGTIKERLATGHMTDIDIDNKTAVVYNYHNNEVLIVTKSEDKTWKITGGIVIHGIQGSPVLSLSLVHNKIYVRLYLQNTIRIYSMSGEHQKDVGRKGRASMSPGELRYPVLCGKDATGSVLVCDCWNDQFQVLSPSGVWRVYQLPGVSSSPEDVVIDESDTLWVLWADDTSDTYKISKFSA